MFASQHLPHSLIVAVKREQVQVQVLAMTGQILVASTLLVRKTPLARASRSKTSGAETIWNYSSHIMFIRQLESSPQLLPESKAESDYIRGRTRPTLERSAKTRSHRPEAREF